MLRLLPLISALALLSSLTTCTPLPSPQTNVGQNGNNGNQDNNSGTPISNSGTSVSIIDPVNITDPVNVNDPILSVNNFGDGDTSNTGTNSGDAGATSGDVGNTTGDVNTSRV